MLQALKCCRLTELGRDKSHVHECFAVYNGELVFVFH